MTGKPVKHITELCSPEIIQTNTITYFLSPEGAETFPDLIERGKQVINFVKDNHKDLDKVRIIISEIQKLVKTA